MVWKVYSTSTEEIVRAGFEDENAAKIWLETRISTLDSDMVYDVLEMDEDEEEAYYESQDARVHLEEDEESSDESSGDSYDGSSEDGDYNENPTEGLTEVDDLEF